MKETERKLTQVEECECFKTCHVNGSTHPDGATWKQDCDICSCVVGYQFFDTFVGKIISLKTTRSLKINDKLLKHYNSIFYTLSFSCSMVK